MYVTWLDAVAFANTLSAAHALTPAYTDTGDETNPTLDLDADGWRLPTESEFEYLSRGGVIGERYSGGDVLDTVANCVGPNPEFYEALPVGSKAPNGFGLYDMSGNADEWVWDRYDDYPPGEVTDPVGSTFTFNSSRVFRGGSFASDEHQCRNADRASGTPSRLDWDQGFRLVRTWDP